MRTPFIAGNWKMNLNRQESRDLASAVAAGHTSSSVEAALCPPSVYLADVAGVCEGSKTGVGGQNMHHEDKGAFTGEISTSMLTDIGCKYVILGHSERRAIFGETNEDISKKVHAALAAELTPIVCVGETLEDREAGKTGEVVKSQFVGSLAGLTTDQAGKVVIAYEPVWAIGTGKVATPEQAQEVHADLRRLLESNYNAAVAETVRIQYGGSVKPDNAAELLSQQDIDGALVGGASLKADSFLAILAAAN